MQRRSLQSCRPAPAQAPVRLHSVKSTVLTGNKVMQQCTHLQSHIMTPQRMLCAATTMVNNHGVNPAVACMY